MKTPDLIRMRDTACGPLGSYQSRNDYKVVPDIAAPDGGSDGVIPLSLAKAYLKSGAAIASPDGAPVPEPKKETKRRRRDAEKKPPEEEAAEPEAEAEPEPDEEEDDADEPDEDGEDDSTAAAAASSDIASWPLRTPPADYLKKFGTGAKWSTLAQIHVDDGWGGG